MQYLRRQDTPLTYDLNASIYIWKRESLVKNKRLIQKKLGFMSCQNLDQLILMINLTLSSKSNN